MRTTLLSTYDIFGGAARAAYRLHLGLRRLGCESSMLVAQRASLDPTVSALATPASQPAPSSLAGRVRRRLRRDSIELARHAGLLLPTPARFEDYLPTRPDGYELFSDDRALHGEALLAQLPPCDLVNLHWIAGLIDYWTFFGNGPLQRPIVWTLHDMNPFTGGCHYDHGCGRYNSQCGCCPQLGSTADTDLSRQIWQRKREVFARLHPDSFHIVAPSRWLGSAVQGSALLDRFPVSIIPYGLDTEIFSPRVRALARCALDIPPDANVVMFAAESIGNRRKGFALLTKALAGFDAIPNVLLLSVGNGEPSVPTAIPHMHLGSLQNDRLLSLAYSAADVFVIPSLQDNLPNTALESLACGTPVVGFDVGGVPDMVRHGVTGLVAPVGDVAEMRNAIAALLGDPSRRMEMSVNCRRIAVEEYSLEIQARRYIKLYESMIEKKNAVLSASRGDVPPIPA